MKVFSIVLLVAVLLAFFYVWGLFLANTEAPDGIKNAFLLTAAVLPLLGIAYTLQSTSYRYSKQDIFMLFYDNKNHQLIDGTERNNFYSSQYIEMFLNLKDADLKIVDPFSKGIDFIEYAIINALTVNFMGNWDHKRIINEIPGGGQLGTYPGDHTGVYWKKQVTPSEIHSIFSHNPFLKDATKYGGFGFYLPGESTIQVTLEENKRTIQVKNRETVLEITISPAFGIPTQQGIRGVIQKDPEDMNRYYQYAYNVDINARFDRFWPITWKRREALRQWHENVGATLEKFHWQTVNEKIKESLQQKAVDLILKETSRLPVKAEIKLPEKDTIEPH